MALTVPVAAAAADSRFKSHVSFDNFIAGEPTEKNTVAFTLNVKHRGYSYRKRSRTFMVGLDENDYSNYALQWMLGELVDDGDEIVCLRVLDDVKVSSERGVVRKDYQEEARRVMRGIQKMNEEERAISIVLEFAAGKLHQTFQRMIQMYEPAMLIVGTRGRSLGGFQGLVANRNSFSKWCLQYSPIPVVVVRPTDKREKKKLKRTNDPARQDYMRILHDSGQTTHEADEGSAQIMRDEDILPVNNPETEAHEVAAALGLPARFDPTVKAYNPSGVRRLSRASMATTTSVNSEGGDSRASSPVALMKSPKYEALDSPAGSDAEAESDEDGDMDDGEAGDAERGVSHAQQKETTVERQKRLHDMEMDEAKALAAGMNRRGSLGDESVESDAGDGSGDAGEKEKYQG